MTIRIARRSEQPPPPEPEGYGDVLTIQFGRTHAAVDIQPTPAGDGKDVSLACGSVVRIDKNTQPSSRFRLRRDDLDLAVSCTGCREHTELAVPDVDAAPIVR